MALWLILNEVWKSKMKVPYEEDRMLLKRSVVFLAAVGVVLCLIPSPLHAQVVNATLLGTVTDVSGAVVADAKVTALEQNTGISHTTQTNGSGNYVFPDMPPGIYTISVEVTGFKLDTRKDVALLVNTASASMSSCSPAV